MKAISDMHNGQRVGRKEREQVTFPCLPLYLFYIIMRTLDQEVITGKTRHKQNQTTWMT